MVSQDYLVHRTNKTSIMYQVSFDSRNISYLNKSLLQTNDGSWVNN